VALWRAYVAWCERHAFAAHDDAAFKSQVIAICRKAGIRTKTVSNGNLYLRDVRLSVEHVSGLGHLGQMVRNIQFGMCG
jgi:hypothetical protein